MINMPPDTYTTLRLRREPPVLHITLHRPAAQNRINQTLVRECRQALDIAARDTSLHVVVLEGLPDIFCLGADFADFSAGNAAADPVDPAELYALWLLLSQGPFISIAHIRGQAMAGGLGFVAACDIALADESASFALPELLFGPHPACVLPFLSKRIGLQRAHYLALSTRPIAARQALDWGLLDGVAASSDVLLRQHLLRLRHLTKPAITRYKNYAANLNATLAAAGPAAIAENRRLFADPEIQRAMQDYAASGRFPWEN